MFGCVQSLILWIQVSARFRKKVVIMADETSTSGSTGTYVARTLEFTPTWALAAVATAFVLISMAVERLLRFLAHVRIEDSTIFSLIFPLLLLQLFFETA